MSQQQEVKVSLSKPLQFHGAGKADCEAEEIILLEPTLRHRKYLSKIQSSIGSLFSSDRLRGARDSSEVSTGAEQTGNPLDDGKAIIGMLMIFAPGANVIDDLNDGMLGLLSNGGCQIPGLDKPNPASISNILEQLSTQDWHEVMGAYLTNFILPSLQSAMTK